MMAWHWIDYTVLVIVGLSAMTGLMRGFVKEIIALGIWIIAIWLGFKYSPMLSIALKPYIPEHTLREILSFVLLLLGVLIAGGLLNMLLSLILSRSGLKGTDRLLGMGFGFVRGAFIVALFIGVINLTSLAQETDFKRSKVYARFIPVSTWIFSFMPNIIDQAHVLDHPLNSKNKPKDEPKDEPKDIFEKTDTADES